MQKEENSKINDLRDRTKQFALRMIKMYSVLPKTTEAQVLGKQVLRSATSVGANYREAYRSRSRAEFIAKTGDCLKELEETGYWLELLVESGIVAEQQLQGLRAECDDVGLVLTVENLNKKAAGSGQPFVNQKMLNAISIPLPPLAEQHQIVAEVERRLSIVAEAESEVDNNLRRADRLRQSILKQAFSGQLVPQDPNDEPASVLLERIRNDVGARRAVPGTNTERQKRAQHAAPLRKPHQRNASVGAIHESPSDHSPRENRAIHELPLQSTPVSLPAFAFLDAVLTAILGRMQPGQEYSRADLADPLGLSTGRWNAAIQELKRRGRCGRWGRSAGRGINARSKRMNIYQLKITLLDIEPKIYRVVQVPADITLRNLHKVIQKVMRWENCHLYQFVKGDTSYAPQSTEFSFRRGLSDKSVPLCELLTKVRNKLVYEYDFGDGWLHEILLQKILPVQEGIHYPVCVDGKHAAPPEDSGGPHGYCDLLEALDDLQHPGHGDASDWLGEDYDPGFFDPEEVNRKLRRIKV